MQAGQGPGLSPPRVSRRTIAASGVASYPVWPRPLQQKPSLANCLFRTLTPGFPEGFSARHLSICVVNAAVPDDPQKEFVVRRPELPLVSVTRSPRHAPVQQSLHGLRLQQPSLEPTRFSPSVENEQTGARRDGQTCLARPNFQARTGTKKYSFSLFSSPRAGLAISSG